ncbi:hypothetical protein AGMMS49531_07980 [Endomicrobiia bacterium]|nr:hypothetical protein AGMMS49531_07980 [Endomicrobiia bacterium]
MDEIIAEADNQLQENEAQVQQKSLLNEQDLQIQQLAPQPAKPLVEVPKIDPMSFWNQQQKDCLTQ